MTITLTREEAQQVLDSLISQYEHPPINVPVIETLRARLSEPELDVQGKNMNQDIQQKIKEALFICADLDTQVDTGFGMGVMDFWVKINGVEFFVTAKEKQK